MSDTTSQSPNLQSPISNPPKKRRWMPTRRGFLIGTGATAGALALGWVVGKPYLHLYMANTMDGGGESGFGALPDDPMGWFEIAPDNSIKLYLSKVEMGQGAHTSMTQLAAEEFNLPMTDFIVSQGTTHIGPADGSGTAGSTSVSGAFKPLRQAAATLREMLRTKASTVLSVPVDQLLQEGKFFVTKDAAKKISFGEIVAAPGEFVVPEAPVALKEAKDFTVIGQSVPRVDIPAKVNGQAIYGYDVKLPGMKFGAILRSPTIEGKLKSVNTDKAKSMDGVISVVSEDGFAGVVADSRAKAHAAVNVMDAVWEDGTLWQQEELDAKVTVGIGDGVTIQSEGDATSLLKDGTTLTADYRSPFAIQTPLEAQAALVDIQGDKARIWCSTQMHGALRSEVAKAINFKEENIEVIPTYVGGGFGRKSGFEVAVEAAKLSKAAGVPVHIGWTRTEELRYGYFRPPTHSRLSAKLNDKGMIEAYEHQQASGDVAAGFLPGFLMNVFGADFGAVRAARFQYNVPNVATVAYRVPLPVRTGWWRGLGLLANVFAIESFMDELAHKAGIDPVQFRLNHLGDSPRQQRMKAVLEAAADKGNWGGTVAEGRAQGFAMCVDADTVVAQVAEISFDATTGKIRVHNFVSAMECGLTVNPDGAKAQIEGNIMWGVGSTLIEEMKVKDGKVVAGNFNEYPLLTIKEAPHVESILLEGDGRPRGVGEPPIGPVSAAIGNAFFALTGTRLRQIPFTPERIKVAMSA